MGSSVVLKSMSSTAIIDPKIMELVTAENFPSLDYEYITTPHPYTGAYYDKRDKHWESYRQHEWHLYPINSKLLKCPKCKVLVAVYNESYYDTPWIYTIQCYEYWFSSLTHVPCNPHTPRSPSTYNLPACYKRPHWQC